MLPLSIFMTALKAIPAVVAAVPEVKQVLDSAIKTLHPDDQDTAKSAYEALVADNDEGYAELDRLAAEAEKN